MFSNAVKPRKYVLFLFKLWSKMLILQTCSNAKMFLPLALSKSLVLCDQNENDQPRAGLLFPIKH